jgi:cupin fold WbuC family metalloprotein
MNKTYFKNTKDIFIIDINNINKLKKNSNNEVKRSRQNLHRNFKSKIQEMLIVFRKNSYVQPHYFKKKNTFFRLINGKFLIKIYEKNKILKRIKLKNSNEMVFLKANTVYDIICLSNKGIIQELMNGPFDKKFFKTIN